jgi:beta-1,4-mannosyl-glycoprotein beta-1,4-N-acetylglucosaminyltransferase
VVDYFVISEANKTHSGKSKPFIFEENKKRFNKFLHKIIYIKVEDMPDSPDAWVRERHQRDALTKGLSLCADKDILIISDADEIPAPSMIRSYKLEQGLCGLNQKLYYYYLNDYQGPWDQAKIIPYELFKLNYTPTKVRYTPGLMLPDAGWHFSYMGGLDKVIEKIESFAHQEYNRDEIKERDRLSKILDSGKDLYGRPVQGKFVEIDGSFPKFIVDNLFEFIKKGWVKA